MGIPTIGISGPNKNPINPMKVQSSAGKSTWEDMIDDLEEFLFLAPKVNANEIGSGFDNGEISTLEKFSNFYKGIGLTFTSAMRNWKASLISAATIGTLLTFCPTLAPLFVVGGTAMGAWQLGNSAYKAMKAKTNEQARAAWQGLGTGLLTFLPSFFGSKAAVKTANKFGVLGTVNEKDGVWSNFLECCKMSCGFGHSNSKLNIWTAIGKTAPKKFYSLFKFEKNPGKGKLSAAIDDIESKAKTKLDDANAELATEKGKVQAAREAELKAKHELEVNKKKQETIQKDLDSTIEAYNKRAKTNGEFREKNLARIAELEERRNGLEANKKRNGRVQYYTTQQHQYDSELAADREESIDSITNEINNIGNEIDNIRRRSNWGQYKLENQNMLNKIDSLNQEMLDLKNAAITLEGNDATKTSDMQKINDKIKELEEKTIPKMKEFLEKIKGFRNTDAFTKLSKEFGKIDAKFINAAVEAKDSSGHVIDWKNELAAGLNPSTDEKIIVLSLGNEEMAKNQSIFTQAIEQGSIPTNPMIYNNRCRFGSLSSPDTIVNGSKDMKWTVDFWGNNSPIIDAITRTIQGTAIYNYFKRNERVR